MSDQIKVFVQGTGIKTVKVENGIGMTLQELTSKLNLSFGDVELEIDGSGVIKDENHVVTGGQTVVASVARDNG